VDLLHKTSPLFPLRNPAIVSMPVGFLCGIIASGLTREADAEARFDDEKLRTYLGIGAE
jgi:cation/acetate symporter